ncbi:MAG: hypothetical protein AAFQ06_09120 [Pseudomonadota bacterium]
MAGNKSDKSDAEPDSVEEIAEGATELETDAEETLHEAADSATEGEGPDAAEADPDAPQKDADNEAEDVPEDAVEEAVVAEPEPAPKKRSGVGFFAFLLGGIIAAALGYYAATIGLIRGPGGNERFDELAARLDAQEGSLSSLEATTASLGEASVEMPDLSGIETAINDVASRVDALSTDIEEIDARLRDLETRPALSGEASVDDAAMAAAMTALRAELSDQQAANEAIADELRSLAETAETSVAQAQESAADAAVQAAFSELRIAAAGGTPFASALNELSVASGVAIPEGLSDVAETGIPTLERIADLFPAAARAALPVALREEASDGDAGDRFTAFMQGQFGGRSLTPMEGDGPDAVLSRALASVEGDDLQGALAEIEALPEAAQEEMQEWAGLARMRVDAIEALDAFAASLNES